MRTEKEAGVKTYRQRRREMGGRKGHNEIKYTVKLTKSLIRAVTISKTEEKKGKIL